MPKRLEGIVFENSRGQELVGVMHHGQGEGPHPCLIVCHGFAGTKVGGSRRFVEFGRYAAERNVSIFRFDFAGSGDSEGDLIDLTLDRELDDLEAAVRAISALPSVDSSRVGVVGHCMGAVTALRAASRNPEIWRTIAWAPFTDLSDTMRRLIGEDAMSVLEEGDEADFLYQDQLFTAGPKILDYATDLDMVQEVSRITHPLLIIHGTEDATVPLSAVEELMTKIADTPGLKRLDVIEGGHHSFPYHQQELFELTLNFVQEKIAAGMER
ncbi:alpha/beta fold hydrolase [Tumebacillus sp. ITR2]|uniref:Alpha/beta fold hydrolase n=1 Tax=Tumebacillus amylolyticus TaxID=2801339 RepID=A0ABS1JBK3_9BACL|nr:alpha/beta fold hydrolase [Tumebacillus amylolyticus]MBL0387615.1 alpha/beta fold hydrolase [Tumebacillus amylolyticus]